MVNIIESIIVLLLGLYVLIRAVRKLPKKLAVAFYITIVAVFATLFVMALYFPESLFKLGEFLHVDLTEGNN